MEALIPFFIIPIICEIACKSFQDMYLEVFVTYNVSATEIKN